MGGKKKGLANKLAKMSDEERARYLQHKADQEEEVRRRKEQLIVTFMKNKTKREEAFSRLNVAKINQQWHQILRVGKIKEMKENCQHLRRWIERVMDLKNRTIDNLMKELDEAEFQYSNNLQAHLQHMDKIIEFYNNYVDELHQTYEGDLDLLLEENSNEMLCYLDNWVKELEHMKTVGYGQEVLGMAKLREYHDYYLTKKVDFLRKRHSDFEGLRKDKESISSDLWRNIASVIASYVEHTDKRRAHLAELRRLDAESAAEISRNQELINYEEVLVEKLKDDYFTMVASRRGTIKSLQETIKIVTKSSIKMKQNLTADLALDAKKLRFLTDESNQTIKYLQACVTKGEHIQQLAQSCRKYETEKEKVIRWTNLLQESESIEVSEYEDEKPSHCEDRDRVFNGRIVLRRKEKEPLSPDSNNSSGDVFEKSEECESNEGKSTNGKSVEIVNSLVKQKFRQKNKVERKSLDMFGEKLKQQLELISPVSEGTKQHRSIKKITICEATKKPVANNDLLDLQQPTTSTNVRYYQDCSDGSSTSSDAKGSNVIDESLKSLSKLDGLWMMYSRVSMDVSELKEEKKLLLEENEMMKDEVREILERAAMENNCHQFGTFSNSRTISAAPKVMVYGSRRATVSAPPKFIA